MIKYEVELKKQIDEDKTKSGMNSIFIKNTSDKTQTNQKRQKTFNFK